MLITDSAVISKTLLSQFEKERSMLMIDAMYKAFDLVSPIIDPEERNEHRMGGYFMITHINPENGVHPDHSYPDSIKVDAVFPIGYLSNEQIQMEKFRVYRDMVWRKAIAIGNFSDLSLKEIREQFTLEESVLPDGALYIPKKSLIVGFSGFLMKKDLALVLTFCYHAKLLGIKEVKNIAQENNCQIFIDHLQELCEINK